MKNGASVDSEINYLTTHFKELRDKLEEIKMSRVEMIFIFDKSRSCFGTEYETIVDRKEEKKIKYIFKTFIRLNASFMKLYVGKFDIHSNHDIINRRYRKLLKVVISNYM